MESNAIKQTNQPVTTQSLRDDLTRLGVAPGMTLIVHSSLSSLGWVCGGAHAVVLALLEVVGPEGTVMVPTHTSHLSDPSAWSNPPVPESWWPVIREHTPAFDKRLTQSRFMGAVAECLRVHEQAVRSTHPQVSFAAVGAKDSHLTDNHSLDDGLGDASPLARLYDLDGHVLLLGVGHDSNTSLHLAEHRTSHPTRSRTREGAPIEDADGCRQWREFDDIDYDEEDFERIGADFEAATQNVHHGSVGYGHAKLIPQRALVDYAVTWMEGHRKPLR